MEKILHSPVHIATINGQEVRFFKTPLNDGRPDFPWHSVDDLMAALKMDARMRGEFLRRMRGGPNAVVKSVPTESGIVQIAPHFMAQGMVDAMVHVRHAPKTSRKQYDNAVFDAGDAMQRIDPRYGSFEYAMAALHRWSTTPEARP